MDSLFEEYKDVFEESSEPVVAKKPAGFAFSPFALQDGVGERSAKKAWIEYIKLRLSGIQAEELVPRIVSKARDMVLIKRGATAADLNSKPFPYGKSKKDLKNWPEVNLQNFYTNLVTTYHHSRIKSNYNLDIEIEKLLLGL